MIAKPSTSVNKTQQQNQAHLPTEQMQCKLIENSHQHYPVF